MEDTGHVCLLNTRTTKCTGWSGVTVRSGEVKNVWLIRLSYCKWPVIPSEAGRSSYVTCRNLWGIGRIYVWVGLQKYGWANLRVKNVIYAALDGTGFPKHTGLNHNNRAAANNAHN